MADPRHSLGQRAESLVCDHLAARGYAIVARNVRVGRREIDIVAVRRDLIVFCEVRARTSLAFGSPLESIDAKKIANVRHAAREGLAERGLRGRALRFDVAAVVFEDPDGRIEYVEDAF
ncbi:MAG: YraN family protein [Sandaracinaceae bacterium]|nr:YraN family protein [Sandaracinaceae bacterium]